MLAIQSKLLLQNLLAWQLYFTLLTEKRRCVKPFLGTHTSSLPVCLDMKTSWDAFFCALKVLTHRSHYCIYFWLVVHKKTPPTAQRKVGCPPSVLKDLVLFLNPPKFGRSFSAFVCSCLFGSVTTTLLEGIPNDLSDYPFWTLPGLPR